MEGALLNWGPISRARYGANGSALAGSHDLEGSCGRFHDAIVGSLSLG